MSRARWNAVLIFAFGVTIIPWVWDFLLGAYAGYNLSEFYDLSNHPTDEHTELAVYIVTHWIYALLPIVSSIAIFIGKSWAPRFWLASCVVIFAGVSIETIAYEYPWTAYWFEALFPVISLVCYRSDLSKEWLQHAPLSHQSSGH